MDRDRKRVLLSMKKGILSAKSPVLPSAADAQIGMRTHGWVTGVTPTAVFVGLYNKLKGMVPAHSISLPPDTTHEEVYSVGQVVKCTVTGIDPAKGLRLSFSASSPATSSQSDKFGGLCEGQIVADAVVTGVERFDDDEDLVRECTLALNSPSGQTVIAKMGRQHFSDHPYGCEVVSASLVVGAVVPKVLVLEQHSKAGYLLVSRKEALIRSAEAKLLPSSLSCFSAGQHVTGYISSITDKSCFVRFLARCTARAGTAQLADRHVANAHDVYKEGQTVMAVVLEADNERMSVSLKPSLNFRSDSALLASLFEYVPLLRMMLHGFPCEPPF